MGSWANSLHVRHQDVDAVHNAIRMLMVGQGYREQAFEQAKLRSVGTNNEGTSHQAEADWFPSDSSSSSDSYLDEDDEGEESDETFDAEAWQHNILDDSLPEVPEERCVCVFRSAPGWIGVLASDNICELAPLLSAHLHTDTLTVLVNDSDSWWFQIHRSGQPLDEFDSMGATGKEDEISPELEAAIDSGDEEALERALLQFAPKGPIHMPDGDFMLPPEMALLRQRIRTGEAGLWSRCRYVWLLARFVFQIFTGRWQAHPIDIGFDIPRATPLEAEVMARHIANVKTVFPQASEKALRDLLPLNRFPSENLLDEFLRIVGLPTCFAHLNYDYLEDHTVEELSAQGIVLSGEMRFTGGSEL